MTSIVNTLTSLVAQVIAKLALPQVSIAFDRPVNDAFGDYATNVALTLFAKLQETNEQPHYGNPRELANALLLELQAASSDHEVVSSISVAGPGFINFTLTEHFHLQQVQAVIAQGLSFGSSNSLAGKKVIVEYSSPNIAKPFTVGHLRSTVIGDSIAAILEFEGATVLRDNHLGDWGTQFGKQIYAIKAWGDREKISASENPVKELVALYVKFHQEAESHPELEDEARAWFKKLEDGDAEARELWRWCVEVSWVEFSRIYGLLDISHSPEFEGGRGLGESFFEDKMAVVIEQLRAKNLLKEGENGAQLVFFPDDVLPPAMILKGDGATLYHTRDLATDFYRLQNYHPDLILNEVGSEQSLYFKQLFAMEELLGWFEPTQRVHVGHGLIRFKDGKMSTRKGNVIWLEDILQEATDKALALVSGDSSREYSDLERKKLAQDVGIGALKWNDLKGSPQRSIVFDWQDILTMKGNSGPYVQYAFARTRSVLRKAAEAGITINSAAIPTPEHTLDQTEIALARSLALFPEAVSKAAQQYSPASVATVVFAISSSFNAFYNQCPILQASGEQQNDKQVQQTRLLLTQATSQVLKNGLALLGIAAPEKM